MKTILGLALLISVGLNLWLIGSRDPSTMGGGKSLTSPDEKFVISASALKDENSNICDGEQFAEIEIKRAKVVNGHTIDGDLLQRVRVWPIEEKSYRGMNGLLSWSEDSKTATIKAPDYELNLLIGNQQ